MVLESGFAVESSAGTETLFPVLELKLGTVN
jgi:hypothetical protein